MLNTQYENEALYEDAGYSVLIPIPLAIALAATGDFGCNEDAEAREALKAYVRDQYGDPWAHNVSTLVLRDRVRTIPIEPKPEPEPEVIYSHADYAAIRGPGPDTFAAFDRWPIEPGRHDRSGYAAAADKPGPASPALWARRTVRQLVT